ncbi:MAG: hypothetical protein BHW34_03875, partial [Firmicutes bacterium CAG:176_59_8]
MSKEKEYQELYDRLMAEVAALHQSNRRRIRSGMRMLVVVTVGLMLLMFLAEGNKVFTLMLWIVSMFGVAAYLIAVEYADYELQKKLEYITQMEQESLGALLELPELPSLPHVGRLPGLLRHGGEQEGRRAPQTEAAAVSEPEKEAAAPAAQGTSAPEEKTEYTVEELLRETIPGGAAQTPASAQVLERLLQEPFLSSPEQYVEQYLPPEVPRLEVTASDDGAILSMVAAGLGVSVLSAFSLAGYENRVKVIPLTQPLSRRLGVAV